MGVTSLPARPGAAFGAPCRRLARALGVLALLWCAASTRAEEFPEYRLKAAFLFNFMVYTDWPAEVGSTLHLCIYGADPFGRDIDALQGKAVGSRAVAVLRRAEGESTGTCQIVFISSTAIDSLPRVLASVRDRAVLTVADSAGAARQGVVLNMSVQQGRVSFEANLHAARSGRLNLSSKLLRLATEVIQ
jgi:hypothetical protein